jgi:carboxymethylenebutenolidase
MKPEDLSPSRPVSPVDLTASLSCPLLGIFGNDDQNPSPEQVNIHEEALKAAGKEYEFHRYDGAGHGFQYYDRAAYRQEQAMDAWSKVWTFFDSKLVG